MCEELKPSEVFLKLWRFRTTHDDQETPDDFALCAAAWAEIRRMENELAWTELREALASKETDFHAPAGLGMTGDEGQQSPTADAEPPLHKGAEAPVRDDGGTGSNLDQTRPSSWQIWKEKVRARLMATRFSVSQVAEASEVKVEDVRGLIDSTRIPANLIRAIERWMDKLEGKP